MEKFSSKVYLVDSVDSAAVARNTNYDVIFALTIECFFPHVSEKNTHTHTHS